MKSFKRVKQETGSYCGPAVMEMLVSAHDRKLDQERMVEACGASSSVMKVGIPLIDLARGLRKIYPELVVWEKSGSKLKEIKTLLAQDYLVAVDWQGVFVADEYEDDEEDGWWKSFGDKMTNAPILKGSQGHYCIVLEVETKKGFLRFADPYGHYAGKDRFVATWEFEERWWDDRIGRDTLGRKKYILEDRLMFLVAKKGDEFPATIGMVRVI